MIHTKSKVVVTIHSLKFFLNCIDITTCKCYNAHIAFIYVVLQLHVQNDSYAWAYRPHYQSVLKFNNFTFKLFSGHKGLLNQLFLIYT